MHWLKKIPAALLVAALLPLNAAAGTTGGVTGRVVDSANQAPIAGVTVIATAPSQTATSVTDASGSYRFLTLAPDTYSVTFTKTGYDPVADSGVSVFADNVQVVNVALAKSLRTIANVSSRAAGSLVKAGTTSDVYSVNAAGQQAAQGLTGAGSLNNAYGAIASVPGVMLDAGEQGWWQTVHIRGGDIDQVGYELDGIPVNRAYDNAPQTMLSSLGSQEVQVYTGGVPASSDAQGISGYVNQVIKTGTFPGFMNGMLSAGYPAFYHQASIEAGGSTPDRLFSYYVGIGGSDQAFRFIDNNDGSSIPNSFFYPVNPIPGENGFVYTGPNTPTLFTTGLGFALATQSLRDDIINMHFAVPHHNSGLRDDIQALWMTSENVNQYFSSTNDLGPNVVQNLYGPLTWDDTYYYSGAPMQPYNPKDVGQYFFPQSPQHAFQGPLPLNLRDPNDNGVGLEKLQYQHVFSPSSYLRVSGYMMYSNWDINGYNSTAQPYYGWELPYFLPDHTYGYNVNYTNQFNSSNLFSASIAYTNSNLSRTDVSFFSSDWPVANYVGTNGLCYDPASGAHEGCNFQTALGINTPVPTAGYKCTTTPLPAACGAGIDPNWLVTNTSFKGALNTVGTQFSGYSLSDQWRPNDKLNVDLGIRLEDFQYDLGSTDSNDPARQFWFKAYNAEYCFAVGANNSDPIQRTGNGVGPCPKVGNIQTVPLAQSPYGPLEDVSGGQYTAARFQPRLGVTYALDPNSVLRASFGIYARPPNSSWTQYNTLNQNLPAYLGQHFYGYGFNTPDHLIRPDTSYNYDMSWEHRLKGTDWSFKVSPFFRATRDQLQNFYIDPQGGLESGLNVGSQQTSGVEFALQKGDFAKDGLSGQLAFTYTHSMIKYQNFSGTDQNVIDQLNSYIKQYDGYTKKGGGSACYFYESAGGAGTNNCTQPGVVANPYYNQPYQNTMPDQAWYTTYDVIPGPAAGANGYATPYVTTMILNYKHKRFAVTNSWNFSSGASYGSPTQTPGYLPESCAKPTLPWMAAYGNAADPSRCDDLGGLPLFTPDKYTGTFDSLGAFHQPWQLQMGLAFTYDISPRITARLNFSNLIDVCGQRGYAWDNPQVCAYSSLPTGFLYPAGNFYPNATAQTPPPQLRYPYSFWFNGNNTGFLGVVEPLQLTGSVQIRL
jgi:Carboxypeptidase regulatory-like domain/TonB dependent receptor/TonB-dependent Receptor Plug Domain